MDYTKLSKKIAYALRHNPQKYELTPDEFGFVAIRDLLVALNKDFAENNVVTVEDILKIAECFFRLSDYGYQRSFSVFLSGKGIFEHTYGKCFAT
ncbi:MAG: RNA 2'-phosphotransferase [Lentisphaeria bacterium]|nr:RNA 2'-phosphotransferase [Lentisphaeria bacterium]